MPRGTSAAQSALLSEHGGTVDLLVDVPALGRKLTRQQRSGGLDAGENAVAPAAGAKLPLDQRADALPLALGDSRIETAVGDDLDIALREQDVDQHPVAFMGVPNAE